MREALLIYLHARMIDILPQLIVNGLIAGAIYALVALGLALIYGILRFVNFAHGNMAMVGAYLFFLANQWWGWSITLSIIFALSGIILIGLFIERIAFRPVRQSPLIVPLLLSIGVSILLESLTLIFFGSNIRSLTTHIAPHFLLGGRIAITDVQIIILLLTISIMVGLNLFLTKTKVGKAIRAVADNREVSAILGINLNRIIAVIFILSSALAGIAGILVAYDQNLHPAMGLTLSIVAFSAVILGGLGNIKGAVLGGFFIGLAENILVGISIAGFSIPTGYKSAVAFVALILILYLKPTGLLGTSAEEAVRK